MKYTSYLLLVISVLACKKEPENKINYSYIDEVLKEKYSFGLGSYWIYQDQDLNLDSIFVSNVNTGITYPCPGCSRNQFIKTTYLSSIQNHSFNHYLLHNFIRYNGGGDYGEKGQPIFILNRPEGYEFNGLIVGATLDSLRILDSTYYNIHKMEVVAREQYQKEFEYDREFYFVPTIGIVRHVIHDTIRGKQVWNLVDYRIEK